MRAKFIGRDDGYFIQDQEYTLVYFYTKISGLVKIQHKGAYGTTGLCVYSSHPSFLKSWTILEAEEERKKYAHLRRS